jgi:hypothetical protein
MSTTEMQRAPAVIKLPPAERSLFDLTQSARCGYCAAVLDGTLIGVLIVAEKARA